MYRIGSSPYRDRFILKGALLFHLLDEGEYRPTRVLDLLGYGEFSDEQIKDLFREFCNMEIEWDGIVFDQETLSVTEIRADQEYKGKRVLFLAFLCGARIRMQVDIAFGDSVSPQAREVSYPTILDLPKPRIKAYPLENVISEKAHTIASLGIQNSRMKDYFDIWFLSRNHSFKGEILVKAITATFNRRNTLIPTQIPLGLSDDFSRDRVKNKQWDAFITRIGMDKQASVLSRTVDDLRIFLLPLLEAAATNKPFYLTWKAGGPWIEEYAD